MLFYTSSTFILYSLYRQCKKSFLHLLSSLSITFRKIGEKWEVKTNYNPTKSAIDNALRSCKGQAKNLIINIQSDITDATLIDGIKMRLHRTDIEVIVIIRNGRIERTIRRQDILK